MAVDAIDQPRGKEAKALCESYSWRSEEGAGMNRPMEVASGIGVLLISLLSSATACKMIFYYQQSSEKVPLLSIISLGETGLSSILHWLVHSSCVGQ